MQFLISKLWVWALWGCGVYLKNYEEKKEESSLGHDKPSEWKRFRGRELVMLLSWQDFFQPDSWVVDVTDVYHRVGYTHIV